MWLSELLKHVDAKGNYKDVEITGVTEDSRQCREGYVFVCTQGANVDGHNYVPQALEKGAVAIVAARDTGAENQVLCENTREAYTLMCANFFGNPAEKLKLIGITGTNGKTTTAFMLYGILSAAGHKCGLIGTVTNIIDGEREYSGLTTPTPFELQQTFKKMADCGTEYCIMEVSSQALVQCRVAGCEFEAAVFTNLTRDHLDYHGTLEAYADAKAMLFKQSKIAVMNYDDEAKDKMLEGSACKVFTYSAKSDDSDFSAKYVRLHDTGVDYTIVGDGGIINRVNVCMPGMFNVYNSAAAIVCCVAVGMDISDACEYMKTVKGVPGRAEIVETDTPYRVIIDFAHTPDGLENIISSLNKYKKGRVIAVFGCGGDRDRTKRPLMGRTVGQLADIAVVTSDNPRTEDPDAIIKDILEGMKNVTIPVHVEADRTKAIAYAMGIAQEGDIVLLAGKGHEDYQIIGTTKIHYDEREIVKGILSAK